MKGRRGARAPWRVGIGCPALPVSSAPGVPLPPRPTAPPAPQCSGNPSWLRGWSLFLAPVRLWIWARRGGGGPGERGTGSRAATPSPVGGVITHVGRRELPWERIRAGDPGCLHQRPAPEMARATSARGSGSGLETPSPGRGGPRGRRSPGGRKEVRPGPRPRDSSSSGAGRVSGSAGFGMTQSLRQGPGASSALPSVIPPRWVGFAAARSAPEAVAPGCVLGGPGVPGGGSALLGMSKIVFHL